MAAIKKDKYTPARLKSDLKKGIVATVYLFYGQEDFLIEQWLKALQQAVLQPGDEDFNLDVLYGNETDGAAVVNIAMSFPMMAEKRMVVVKDFHHLSEKSLNLITAYIQKPSASSCLALTTTKLGGTNAVIKALAKYSKVLEAKPLYDNHVPAWVKAHVKERGFTISDEAITLLQLNAGNSLRRLSSEIDKIELLLKDRHEISVQDVEAIVGASKEFNVFEFADAVAEKNLPKSLRILNRLLELGESPIGILVMLTRHYTIIAKAKEMIISRMRKDEMGRALRVNPYFIDKYVRQAAKYNKSQLGDIFQLLLTADQHLKSSYQKPKLVLESLIF